MTLPAKQQIFELLNSTRHHIDEDAQNSLFPEILPNTSSIHAEYWIYSDLYNIFDRSYFPTTPSMSAHTWQRLKMPSPSGKPTDLVNSTIDFHSDHVQIFNHAYVLFPHTSFKNAKDLKLSRYACWCMTRDIPELIFAHTYFMAPAIQDNMTFNEIRDLSYQFARVSLRQKYTQCEKRIGGILNKYDGHFSLFHHNMIRAFFYGYDTDMLKHIYRIPSRSNDPLANYMGAASLHAIICAMENAISRFNTSPTRNANVLDAYLCNELDTQRTRMINRTNRRPEQDICTTPISSVAKQFDTAKSAFIKKYSATKIR